MLLYLLIKYAYQLIVGVFCVLFAVNVLRYRELKKQLLGVFVLLPFLLRLFLIK